MLCHNLTVCKLLYMAKRTIYRTFSLSQMNNVELARTLSWRENALFKERKEEKSLTCRKLNVPLSKIKVKTKTFVALNNRYKGANRW